VATFEAWRALVDKELAGAPFDKLVQRTAEGLAIEPLYVEAPANAMRPIGTASFRVCMRATPGEAAEHIDGGADALWLDGDDLEGVELAATHDVHVIFGDPTNLDTSFEDRLSVATEPSSSWFSWDPLASGLALGPKLEMFWQATSRTMVDFADNDFRSVRVSTLPYHAAGADAADELAIALSTAVAYLRAMTGGASQLWFQISVGRDTFGEICKLRALRVVVAKLFAAANITDALPPIHAVSSSRAQAARDPWVNMLRVTTEVFAAAIGGADLITPLAFDSELAEQAALGRRLARNTALVLRDESNLGRVIDAAGGSYYIESRTDALAREAWRRFQQLERDGGIANALASGAIADKLAASWDARAQAIAKRKEPILGVSEFANTSESLPSLPRHRSSHGHRDSEAFEALRATVDASPRDVALITLGPAAEHRARVGFATSLFATAGIRVRVVASDAWRDQPPRVACICGSDERYAAEAATVARELRTAGIAKLALAGKPNATAGVDAYIYMGCDVIAALEELLA
jgi:methylmalonyl-CoA mutase